MISIVIPVYNGENYICRTYAQIIQAAEMLPQEDNEVELLFVNDGSTDKSGHLLKQLAKKDLRVRVIEKENGGIASARNTGLEQAKGEYICFVDQDDVMHVDMLCVLLADIKDYHADFVQGRADSIRSLEAVGKEQEGESYAKAMKELVRVVDTGTEAYEQHIKSLVMRGIASYEDCVISGYIWCCMFRTHFLRENNISFFRFCDYEDDWIFLILAMQYAKRICFDQRIVYSWYINMESESHKRVEKDRYLADFYEKHRRLRAFFWESLKNVEVDEKLKERYGCELQKQALLWSLSNETGRGIDMHQKDEIVEILSCVVEELKKEGIYKKVNRYPLYISIAGAKGLKRFYYIFRDKLLTFLLLHGHIGLAVELNKRILHGRWHI